MTVKYYLNAKLINEDASARLAPTGQYFPGNIMIDFEKKEITYFEDSVFFEKPKKSHPWGMVDLSEATETQGLWERARNIQNGNSLGLKVSRAHYVDSCLIPGLGEVKVGDSLTFRGAGPTSKYYGVDSIQPLFDSEGNLTGEYFLRIGYKDSYDVKSSGSWGKRWVIGKDFKRYSTEQIEAMNNAA